jgi:hypothetical protein
VLGPWFHGPNKAPRKGSRQVGRVSALDTLSASDDHQAHVHPGFDFRHPPRAQHAGQALRTAAGFLSIPLLFA